MAHGRHFACEEGPEPTEVSTHVFGADEDTKYEESSDIAMPHISHKVPDIALGQGLKRNRWNLAKAVVCSCPAGPKGDGVVNPRLRQDRRELRHNWPDGHNGT